MADLESVKIVDEEKQQLLASAPEQVKSGAGRRTVSKSDMFTRVVLVLLVILNFAQWHYSVIARDASIKPDECVQKDNAVLPLQDQVRGLCLDRIALLKSVEAANKLASLPDNSGHEALHSLEDFLGATTIESEAISEAFKLMEKALAEQNELLNSFSHPHPQQYIHSLCEMLAC